MEKTQNQQNNLNEQLGYEETYNMPISESQIRFYLTELKMEISTLRNIEDY